MWRTKIWKFKDEASAIAARARMEAWLDRNRHRVQYEEIFIDNAYGIQYRKLMRIY